MSVEVKNLPVQFAFRIHEEVSVPGLGVTGFVLARCDRGAFIEYRVTYFYDGRHHDEWLLGKWLEAVREKVDV